MRKKPKNAQPVTEETPELSDDNVEEDLITPEPQQPKPEPPLSIEGVAMRQAQLEKEVQEGFNQLIERLTPVIQLSDQLAARQQQQKTEGQEGQPQRTQANGLMGALMELAQLAKSFGLSGGSSGDTELAQLGNQYGKLVLKRAIEDINKPSIQEQIGEAVLERFVSKKSKEVTSDLE